MAGEAGAGAPAGIVAGIVAPALKILPPRGHARDAAAQP
jgi:hypothetical protein